MPLTYYKANMLAFRELLHCTYLVAPVFVDAEMLLTY